MRGFTFSAWMRIGMVMLSLAAVPAQAPAWDVNALQLDDFHRAEAFRAAGAVQRGGRWLLCPRVGDDEGDASIGDVVGLGDGSRLAVIVSGPTARCAGNRDTAGSGFRLLERDRQGQWKLIYSGSGSARLDTAGVRGQPSLILLPDQGGCRSVMHWDGENWRAGISASPGGTGIDCGQQG